ELAEGIRIYQAGDHAAAAQHVGSETSAALTREVRTALLRMERAEDGLLAARSAASAQSTRVIIAVELAGIALLVGLATLSMLIVRRSDRERAATSFALEASNVGLEIAIADRTADLRAANEEIRRGAEILDNTIRSMADAVLVTDRSGRAVMSNPAAWRLFGVRDDAGADAWQQVDRGFMPDGVTPVAPEDSPLGRTVRGESVDNQELVLRLQPGAKEAHILAIGRPIRDSGGHRSGAVVVYRDMTREFETERQLRQSQRMEALGQLTGGIAHDFNNILTVITGTIEILTEAVADPPPLAAPAAAIDAAAARGADLTRHLLAFARKQPLQPRATDLNDLIMGMA